MTRSKGTSTCGTRSCTPASLRRAERLIAVSEYQNTELEKSTGFRAGRVIPWGIEPLPPAVTPTVSRPPVLGVGSLVPVKNWKKWLRVLALTAPHFPGLQAELIGDGPERKKLEGLARQLGLQFVDSDAENKAQDADAALQDLGADHVGHAYVTASVCVWDHDPAVADARLRRTMGRNGKEYVKREYRWEAIMAKYDRLIGAVTSPVLILHGRSDTLIPVDHAEALVAASGGRAELLAVDGAGHDDIQNFAAYRDALAHRLTGLAR